MHRRSGDLTMCFQVYGVREVIFSLKYHTNVTLRPQISRSAGQTHPRQLPML